MCNGSLPPGAPVDGYGQLVRDGTGRGRAGDRRHRAGPAACGAASGPDLVTPNLEEAEAAISGDAG